jgi:hypothetical protein
LWVPTGWPSCSALLGSSPSPRPAAGDQHRSWSSGAFFVHSIAISPFERGNGRTARVMVLHLPCAPRLRIRRIRQPRAHLRRDALRVLRRHRPRRNEDLDRRGRSGPVAFLLRGVARRGDLEAAGEARSRNARARVAPSPAGDPRDDKGARNGCGFSLDRLHRRQPEHAEGQPTRLVERGMLERIGTKRGTVYRLPGLETATAQTSAEEPGGLS